MAPTDRHVVEALVRVSLAVRACPVNIGVAREKRTSYIYILESPQPNIELYENRGQCEKRRDARPPIFIHVVATPARTPRPRDKHQRQQQHTSQHTTRWSSVTQHESGVASRSGCRDVFSEKHQWPHRWHSTRETPPRHAHPLPPCSLPHTTTQRQRSRPRPPRSSKSCEELPQNVCRPGRPVVHCAAAVNATCDAAAALARTHHTPPGRFRRKILRPHGGWSCGRSHC
jgi:hypothetical protein